MNIGVSSGVQCLSSVIVKETVSESMVVLQVLNNEVFSRLACVYERWESLMQLKE